MIDAAALAPGSVVVHAAAAEPLVAGVRAARGAASVLVVIDAAADPLARALMVAAIAPLAEELAPRTRVNAVFAAVDAAPDEVIAAARWLSGARSTTGQVLRVGFGQTSR